MNDLEKLKMLAAALRSIVSCEERQGRGDSMVQSIAILALQALHDEETE